MAEANKLLLSLTTPASAPFEEAMRKQLVLQDGRQTLRPETLEHQDDALVVVDPVVPAMKLCGQAKVCCRGKKSLHCHQQLVACTIIN